MACAAFKMSEVAHENSRSSFSLKARILERGGSKCIPQLQLSYIMLFVDDAKHVGDKRESSTGVARDGLRSIQDDNAAHGN